MSILKVYLETKLNLSGCRGCLIKGCRKTSATWVIDRIVLSEGFKEALRQIVGVIQYVEKLGAELNVERIRDAGYPRILE
jgi:hypothetical protein